MNKGKINIGKVTSNKQPYTFMTLEIEDVNGCLITKCDIPIESFGYLISGTGGINCEFDVMNVSNIGKTREVKDVNVECGIDDNKDQILALAKEYEVDGWFIIHEGNIGNHHKIFYDYKVNKKFNKVTYVRFI